jgi:hypothetical protein
VCTIHQQGKGLYFVHVKVPKGFEKFDFALTRNMQNGRKVVYQLKPSITNIVHKSSEKILYPKKNGEKHEQGKMEK